jgi:hypothetical protein
MYKTRVNEFSGSSYGEVKKKAVVIYKEVKSKTKRKPYIKSKFFNNEKIFFDFFWLHLSKKPQGQRKERLRYFFCALELIRKTTFSPTEKKNPNNKDEILYRFVGKTNSDKVFVVQIKESKKTKTKQLMSIFPKKTLRQV